MAGENFYWLSTKPDVSNWAASNGRYTPIQSYADFTSLQKLPRTTVKLTSTSSASGADEIERVTLENTGTTLAFFVHLGVEAAGRDVAPIIWEDNYISLMPGEKRTVTATVYRKDLRGAAAQVKLDGWNIAP
jgi:exo-1,4-beta-D-glucosaminidase